MTEQEFEEIFEKIIMTEQEFEEIFEKKYKNCSFIEIVQILINKTKEVEALTSFLKSKFSAKISEISDYFEMEEKQS